MQIPTGRRFLVCALACCILAAAACSSFSSSEAPTPSLDAGDDAAVPVTTAEAGIDAATCETTTFDMNAIPVGKGWADTYVDGTSSASLTRIDGGVRAGVDGDHFSARAALVYRIAHRESVVRVTLRGTFASASTVTDSWPFVAVLAHDDGVLAGSLEVQESPMSILRAGFVPGDGGPYAPQISAPIGSFPLGIAFPLSLTLDGPWSDGPTVSFQSNGFDAGDVAPATGKLPGFSVDASASQTLELNVGIVVAPKDGMILELRAMQLEVCRR